MNLYILIYLNSFWLNYFYGHLIASFKLFYFGVAKSQVVVRVSDKLIHSGSIFVVNLIGVFPLGTFDYYDRPTVVDGKYR